MDVRYERVHAAVEDDFVVFLVGMHVNRLWKVHRWLPVFLSAPRMVREQRERPPGLLGSRVLFGGIRDVQFVQYWRSFEALRSYARADGTDHRSWWQRFNAEFAESGDVGIWHETYLVSADRYETVYRNAPPLGLGATGAATLVPASGEHGTAAGRLARTDGDGAPFTPAGKPMAGEPTAEGPTGGEPEPGEPEPGAPTVGEPGQGRHER